MIGETDAFFPIQIEIAQLIQNSSFYVSVRKLDAGPTLTALLPTKIGEFLACGRPIVVNRGTGDMDDFIKEFDSGVILDSDPDNLKQSAVELIQLD